MKTMLDKVRAYIRENRLLEEKDKLVLGVSGGADSVCLLLVLFELQREYALSLFVVHVNHGIRGKEAFEDEAFVRALAGQYKTGYESFHADIPAIARERGLGEEEAGRLYRYEVMEQVRRRLGADKIAVAHNENDCAETLLLHLFRGTGLTGLSGIAPVRGRIIRPLLCVSRREIEAWLLQRGQAYRTDQTNFSAAYTRNRLRWHLLPLAEQEINERAVEHTARAAFFLREVSSYMEKRIKEAFARNVSEKNGAYFIGNSLLEEEGILQKGVIMLVLESLAGKKKDLEGCHVAMVRELFDKQTGKEGCLPYKMRAQRDCSGVWIFRAKEEKQEKEKGFLVQAPGEYALPDGRRVSLEIFPAEEKIAEIPKNDCTKWFDYDRIKNGLSLRHREAGDYFQIGKDGGRKKLKEDLIDRKIPRSERDQLWLLADGSHIMWVLGGRTSEAYRITEETVTILRVKISGGKCDGR